MDNRKPHSYDKELKRAIMDLVATIFALIGFIMSIFSVSMGNSVLLVAVGLWIAEGSAWRLVPVTLVIIGCYLILTQGSEPANAFIVCAALIGLYYSTHKPKLPE